MIQFFTSYVDQTTLYPSIVYPLTVTVVDSALNPIEGARVRVTASATASGYTIGDVILTGLTNASGVLTTDIESSEDIPVSIRARKSTTPPLFKSSDVPNTFINGTGLVTTLVLVSDE
jgi:hypothetical protein